MTDRELLELAAKAAGLVPDGAFGKGLLVLDGGKAMCFDPLNDDGTALRLAVRLEMHITSSKTDAWASTPEVDAIQPFEGDPLRATRRAIVRAAAALQLFKEAQ